MPGDWWLKKSNYFMYMMRELTAVFAAVWLLIFLAHLPEMGAGGSNLAAYNAWWEFITSPGWVIFSLVALVFVFYHAITWFLLTGTVLYVRLGKEPIPKPLIVGSMFAAWLGVSAILAFIISYSAIGG
jgi:fumarate reductase subunit C